MSITWSGNGGAFTILGAIACAMRAINGVRNDVDPTPDSEYGSGGPQVRCITTAIDNIIAAHSTAQQPYYDGIRSIEDAFVSAQDSTISSLKSLAQSELIAIVNADSPRPDLTLSSAMKEFVRQMKAGSQTVLRCTVGQSVAAGGSNVGTSTVLCSVTGRYGLPQEYAIAEAITVTCTGDADGNGDTATAGSEPLSIVSPAAGGDKFAIDWPLGSGTNTTMTMIDPTIDAGSNYLTNSNFETFTVANLPDNWVAVTGTVGTAIKKDVVNVYGVSSSAALQFVGDSSTTTTVTQTFGTSSGTETELAPATVYAFNMWIYLDVQPAAGVLKIELIDSTNTVINDDAGTANAITQTLSTTSATTWTAVNGFFRTPTNIPSVIKLRIRLSTAMSTGSKLNMDWAAFGLPTQLYAGGPYLVAFRGGVDATYNDVWTVTVTNNRAGIFQTFFEQAFDMTQMGLILPSAAAGNTIDDALVA